MTKERLVALNEQIEGDIVNYEKGDRARPIDFSGLSVKVQADIAYQLTRIADTQEALIKLSTEQAAYGQKFVADQLELQKKALESLV